MKTQIFSKSALGLLLIFSIANSAFAADAEIKLDSKDGTTKFAVKDKNSVVIFSADSAGNAVLKGSAPVAGARFSVGGSTFVVKDGNIGIGTANPGAPLEVAGQVKITGGAPGANKVLTSDVDGLATWQTAASTFSIGDTYGGGIIFWLDSSGKHGLIAATADQSAGIAWSPSSLATGASFDAVYGGRTNTSKIVVAHGAGSYAAQVCNDYAVTVNNEYYDDWYLPSKYELNLLYGQKGIVGGFTGNPYWSSTEDNTTYAWTVYFDTGALDNGLKTNTKNVRCVRAGP